MWWGHTHGCLFRSQFLPLQPLALNQSIYSTACYSRRHLKYKDSSFFLFYSQKILFQPYKNVRVFPSQHFTFSTPKNFVLFFIHHFLRLFLSLLNKEALVCAYLVTVLKYDNCTMNLLVNICGMKIKFVKCPWYTVDYALLWYQISWKLCFWTLLQLIIWAPFNFACGANRKIQELSIFDSRTSKSTPYYEISMIKMKYDCSFGWLITVACIFTSCHIICMFFLPSGMKIRTPWNNDLSNEI